MADIIHNATMNAPENEVMEFMLCSESKELFYRVHENNLEILRRTSQDVLKIEDLVGTRA